MIHQFHGKPIEKPRVRRDSTLRPKVRSGAHNSDTKIGLPNAIHNRSGSRWRATVCQPSCERKSRRLSTFWPGMQKAGHSGLDLFSPAEEIAPVESIGVSRCVSLGEYQLRDRFGEAMPASFDPIVGILPLRNGCPS